MVDVALKIYRNEGMLAFYKGLTPNLVKVFPSAGLFFLSYEGTLNETQFICIAIYKGKMDTYNVVFVTLF